MSNNYHKLGKLLGYNLYIDLPSDKFQGEIPKKQMLKLSKLVIKRALKALESKSK